MWKCCNYKNCEGKHEKYEHQFYLQPADLLYPFLHKMVLHQLYVCKGPFMLNVRMKMYTSFSNDVIVTAHILPCVLKSKTNMATVGEILIMFLLHKRQKTICLKFLTNSHNLSLKGSAIVISSSCLTRATYQVVTATLPPMVYGGTAPFGPYPYALWKRAEIRMK